MFNPFNISLMKKYIFLLLLNVVIINYSVANNRYFSDDQYWELCFFDIPTCDPGTGYDCPQPPYKGEILDFYINRKKAINNMEYYNVEIRQGEIVVDHFFIRQDEQKVYGMSSDNSKEILMYDFSLEVGDSILTDGKYSKVVVTDSVFLLNGLKVKRITYDDNRGTDIEYIGNTENFIVGLAEYGIVVYNAMWQDAKLIYCETFCNDETFEDKCMLVDFISPCDKIPSEIQTECYKTNNSDLLKIPHNGSFQIFLPDGRRFDATGREIK